jgi:hypothetical protein
VTDLAPLAAMVKLQSLGIGGCSSMSDLAPLAAITSLKCIDGKNPAMLCLTWWQIGSDRW